MWRSLSNKFARFLNCRLAFRCSFEMSQCRYRLQIAAFTPTGVHIHAHMHVFTHSYTNTHMCTLMHTHLCSHMHTYLCSQVHTLPPPHFYLWLALPFKYFYSCLFCFSHHHLSSYLYVLLCSSIIAGYILPPPSPSINCGLLKDSDHASSSFLEPRGMRPSKEETWMP